MKNSMDNRLHLVGKRLREFFQFLFLEMVGFCQRNKFLIVSLIGVSVIVYFPLISGNLVNCYDGIWEGNYHVAGAWELSLGRWFWLYIDRLRFGISEEPFVSLITISCYVIGTVFAVDLTQQKSKGIVFLAGTLFLTNVVVLLTLSYRFMSPTFGFAFLFGNLGIWLCYKIKNIWVGVLVGSVFLCFGLGAYQAFIGSMCLCVTGFVMSRAMDEEKSMLLSALRGSLSILLGCIEYMIVWEIHLKFTHVSKSSYGGADGYSFYNTLTHLPQQVRTCFQCFLQYYGQSLGKTVFFLPRLLYVVFFVTVVILLGIHFVRVFKKNKINGVLFLLFSLAIPLEGSAILFIATNTGFALQMTGAFALIIPILLMILIRGKEEKICVRYLNLLLIVVSCILLYSSCLQIIADQKTMRETKQSSINIVGQIETKLVQENLLSDDLEYCFVGLPCDSAMYYRSKTFWNANGYTYVGGGWSDEASCRKVWGGLVNGICQLNMKICTPERRNEVLQDPRVAQMTSFPNDGSILKIDDVVIIHLREY